MFRSVATNKLYCCNCGKKKTNYYITGEATSLSAGQGLWSVRSEDVLRISSLQETFKASPRQPLVMLNVEPLAKHFGTD